MCIFHSFIIAIILLFGDLSLQIVVLAVPHHEVGQAGVVSLGLLILRRHPECLVLGVVSRVLVGGNLGELPRASANRNVSSRP